MTHRRAEDPPAAVPLAPQAGAERVAQVHPVWASAKPCVWTARMLTALVQGVEGGQWFRLYDQVFAERNLLAAYQQVAQNKGAPGVDHVTVEEFGRQIPENLWQLSDALKAGDVHVVDADLKGYFDSIPHDRLMERLQEKIADGSVLSLIEAFLTTGILEETTLWTPESGAPQGAVLSPLLSNIYLDPLDHWVAKAGVEMVRYADDFVILCRTADEAQHALDPVRQWVSEHGLVLHPTKTRIVDSRSESFAFLGYEFRGEKHWPRQKSLQKLKAALRPKTKRNNGTSLACVIADVNQTLRGWFTYFQHSSYRNVFQGLDSWVRMRLRSLLRKRIGLRGRGRGADHQRWPNAYFAEHGLFSFVAAHVSACQSSRR